MSVDEHLRAGRLPEALVAAQDAVRADPAQGAPRLLLAQLLMVMGQWDRASNQWKVLGDLDPNSTLLAQTFASLIRIEEERRAVFAGERLPVVFGEPERWTGSLVQAVRLAAQGQYPAAQELMAAALEEAPAVGGTINGEPFAWLADSDSRLGPMIEAVIEGRYVWIPFTRIRGMLAGPPATLRDLIWAPFHFTWINGGQAAGFVPVRYPGTEKIGDDPARLARRTDWAEPAAGWFHGVGQRVLATDQANYALLDIRLVEFVPAPDETVAASNG